MREYATNFDASEKKGQKNSENTKKFSEKLKNLFKKIFHIGHKSKEENLTQQNPAKKPPQESNPFLSFSPKALKDAYQLHHSNSVLFQEFRNEEKQKVLKLQKLLNVLSNSPVRSPEKRQQVAKLNQQKKESLAEMQRLSRAFSNSVNFKKDILAAAREKGMSMHDLLPKSELDNVRSLVQKAKMAGLSKDSSIEHKTPSPSLAEKRMMRKAVDPVLKQEAEVVKKKMLKNGNQDRALGNS